MCFVRTSDLTQRSAGRDHASRTLARQGAFLEIDGNNIRKRTALPELGVSQEKAPVAQAIPDGPALASAPAAPVGAPATGGVAAAFKDFKGAGGAPIAQPVFSPRKAIRTVA